MQLSELPNPSLTESLFRKEAESLGHPQTSSHWVEMHKHTVAAVEDQPAGTQELRLRGFGFGNLRCHPLQWPLEQLTIWLNLLRAQGRDDVVRGMNLLRNLFRKQPRDMRLQLTYDVVRQVLVWTTINKFLPKKKSLTWCVIGDGYGVFSALIKAIYPEAKLYLIDLPKTLIFQTVYLQLMHPDASHSLAEEERDTDFVYCAAPHLPEVRGGIDVFVNVASMQEMTKRAIKGYFDFIRKAGGPGHLFYCCNRVEKTLPDGEVVRFEEYPWSEEDTIYLDGICSYHRFFLHLRTRPQGPKVFGIRVPFINYYDGDVRHRVATLG